MSNAKYELKISGMTCQNCVGTIERHLSNLPNITYAKVNLIDESVAIHVNNPTDNTKPWLMEEIEDIGYTPSDPPPPPPFFLGDEKYEPPIATTSSKQKKLIRSHWLKGIVGILTGVSCLILSLTGVGTPFALMIAMGGIGAILTAYLGKESFKAALRDIRSRTLSMDSLFSLSSLISVGVSIAAFFVPGLPQLFDAALLLFGFRHIGLGIEQSTRRELTQNTVHRRPIPSKTALLTEQGVTTPCNVADLVPGQIIVVRAGELVPTNGVLLEDEAFVFTTHTNGGTLSQKISNNTEIYQGTIISDEQKYVRIKVTAKAQDSYYPFLDKRIQQAKDSKNQSALQTTANKITQWFLPSILVISILAAIIVGSVFLSPITAICCAAAILVAACPCALGFVTPTAFGVGMDKAFKHGVYFNDTKALEDAAQIDTAVYDYTGTFTTGSFTVTKSTIPDKMLPYLALIQRGSNKLVGKAINQHLENLKIEPAEFKSSEINHSCQSGVAAQIDNEEFVIGNQNMMKDIDISRFQEELKDADADQIIYFARGKVAEGYMLLQGKLRDGEEGAKKIVQANKNLGIETHVVTGGPESTAKRIAAQLNIPIEHVKTNYLSDSLQPNSKPAYIKSLKAAGRKVAMIGDSENDIRAFTESHFSVAVKSIVTTQETQQEASACTYSESLWPTTAAFAVAKQTVSNIKQNLLFSLGYNLTSLVVFGGILVAIGFAVNPALGAALMVLQSALLLANTRRFKHQPVPGPSDIILPTTPQQSTHAQTQKCLSDVKNCFAPKQQSCQSAKIKPVFAKPIQKATHTEPHQPSRCLRLS